MRGSTAIKSPSAIGKIVTRVFAEWLIWLPIWLVLTANMSLLGKLGMVITAMSFSAMGLLFHLFPAAWRRLSIFAVILILVAVAIGQYPTDMLIFPWLAILLWRGRYLTLRYSHYALAFGLCCAVIIVTSLNAAWADYRLALILMAVFWIVVWFISLNKSLIEYAGLHHGMVTRPVRKASRRYLLLFLTAAVLVIAFTASYGQQLLTPKHVVNPNNSWIDPNQFIQPPQNQTPMNPVLMPEEPQGKPSIVWDIVMWTMIAVGAVGAIWFARLVWKDRTWTWNGILKSIKEWLFREKRAEELPYVEESRSLRKEKKKGPGRFDSLFRGRDRALRWDQLDNPEKVRRLYEEAVLAGIEQGYVFKVGHTPSETLEELMRWRDNQNSPGRGSDKTSSYWSWFSNIRASLNKLYEKARYSPHEVTPQDVDSLKATERDRK